MKATKHQRGMAALMAEKIIFGGLVLTRQRVYDWMIGREFPGGTLLAIDWFVFRPDALPAETPEYPGTIPD